MNEYCEKLCEEIKLHYLKDCLLFGDTDHWVYKSQDSLRNFVLARNGWKKGNNSDELYIYNDIHPIIINILYCGSAGMLLLTTAINIAKAELIDELNKQGIYSTEDNIFRIVDCVNKQDWVIPFIRKKQ
jgi:hypothetical protein